MAPRVSVVIGSYNHGKFIGKTIQSILDQTFRDFELIIVDDGSPDDTAEVVAGFADPRIRFLRQENSGRPSVPRNRGIQMAAGEFIAFMDSDDLWLPEKLAKQVAEADAHPEAALVYCWAEKYDGTQAQGRVSPYRFKASGKVFNYLLFYNFIPGFTVLARRAIIQDLQGFDERRDFLAVEDYDLWLRIAARYPIRCVPEILGRYRVHPNNTSGNRFVECDRVMKVLEKTFAAVKVHPWLRRKALAKLDLRRFRYSVKIGQPEPESIRYLHQALKTDPTNATAAALLGVSKVGLLGRFKGFLAA